MVQSGTNYRVGPKYNNPRMPKGKRARYGAGVDIAYREAH